MPSTIVDRINGVTTSAAVKTPVKILTTTPITLSGAQTLQSVALTAYSGPGLPADRVCVNGQADATTNGIYLVQTGAWTREPDFDGARDAVTGTLVSVLAGTYIGSLWDLTTTDNPIIIGTSNITFSQTSIGAFSATSTTSNAIGTGSKTFTTSSALPLPTGQFVVIVDSANSANYMHGQITSYIGTTLIVNVLDVGGSGTKTSWNIYISSPQGAIGPAGPTGTVGTTGSPASGNLTKFSGATSITNGDLSGDISTSGTLVTTLPNVNGNVGSFTYSAITVNAKGQVTAASNGAAPSNYVLQQVRTETGAEASGSTSLPYDDTIPQSTEGDQYMSLAITPQSSSSRLVIEVVFNGALSTGGSLIAALFQDATASALAVATSVGNPVNNDSMQVVLKHNMTSGTTSSTTFKVRVGGSLGGTVTFNGASAARLFGGAFASSIIITEYAS
jgi:hypothetical protein